MLSLLTEFWHDRAYQQYAAEISPVMREMLAVMREMHASCVAVQHAGSQT